MSPTRLSSDQIRDYSIFIEPDNIFIKGEPLSIFPIKYRRMVSSLKFSESENQDKKCIISFSGINDLKEIDFLTGLEQKFLRIQFGYQTLLSPKYRIYISSVTPSLDQGITCNLEGYSEGINLDIVKNRIWQRVNTYSDIPNTFVRVSDIVEQIGEENGLVVVVDITEPLKGDIRTIQQNVSDKEFLDHLVQIAKPQGKTGIYEYSIENGTLYFTISGRYKQPEFIFRYRDFESGIVKKFLPEVSEKKGKRSQVKETVAVDKNKKEVVRYNAISEINVDQVVDEVVALDKYSEGKDLASRAKNSAETKIPPGTWVQETDENGKVTLKATIQKDKDYLKKEQSKLIQPIQYNELDEIKASYKNEKGKYEELTANLECLGLPNIKQGIVIAMEDVGKKYSGIYYVTDCDHVLSDNGYITKLKIKRSATETGLPENKVNAKNSKETVSYNSSKSLFDKAKEAINTEPDPDNQGKYIWPIHGMRQNYITSNYGVKRPKTGGGWRRHEGLDISNTTVPGTVNIIASAPGTVVLASVVSGYGKTVQIKDDYGRYQTYAHLHNFNVSKGEYVRQYQALGTMGDTGRGTGTHLHFEFRTSQALYTGAGNDIDPKPFLPKL